MPYASLHEAFKTFGECCPSGAIAPPFSIETTSTDASCPELAQNYVNRNVQSPPPRNRQRGGFTQSKYPTVNFDSSAEFSNLNRYNDEILDYSPMQTNVIEDRKQRDVIAKTKQRNIDISWQVPKNQSLTISPDDGVSSFAEAPFQLPPYMTNKRRNQNQIGGQTGIVPGDCSDDTCLILLNHLLKCSNCSEKLKHLLNLNKKEEGFFSFLPETDITGSKIVFFLVVIVIIIAIYELLRNIFKKLN